MDERSSALSRAGQGARRRRDRLLQWRAVLFGLLLLLIPGEPSGQPSPAENGRPVVYLAPIEGIIDLGLAPFVNRVLQEAAGAEAPSLPQRDREGPVGLPLRATASPVPNRRRRRAPIGSLREARRGIVPMTLLGPCRALEPPGPPDR